MDTGEGIADLHMHTTASDGMSTVRERIEQAKEHDLDAIAITDHDSISTDLEDRVKPVDGIELITGVEARAEIDGTKIEILGYYVDPSNRRLRDTLEEIRGLRHKRNRELTERLNRVTGLDVSYDELRSEKPGVIGRPHFAEILVERGFVDSISQAFDEYLGRDRPAYVETEKLSYDEVLSVILGAEGVPSLAHPGRIRSDRVEEIVETLVGSGLEGIEVWYPYDESSIGMRSDVGVEEANEIAEKHGLVKTGGSDCHGPGSGHFRIGSVRVPEEELEELRRRGFE
ncbi:MAG: PHP domain-containing protein [Halobacteria archaeon]|nr:PHP domain-containing protein [Halobacteria archaeon]